MQMPEPVLPALGINSYRDLCEFMEDYSNADDRLVPQAVMAIVRTWEEHGDTKADQETLFTIARCVVLEMSDFLFQMNGGGLIKVLEFIRDNPFEVALKHQELLEYA